MNNQTNKKIFAELLGTFILASAIEFNTIYFDATNKFAYYWKDDTYKSLKCSAYYPAVDTLSVSTIETILFSSSNSVLTRLERIG